MSDIPEEALKTIKEGFGNRFVPHAADEAEPHAEKPFASVFPESAEEVQLLMKLAARHSIPLVARGAGTALYLGKVPRAIVVRFDAMRRIQLPEEPEEGWVEVEPGVTWVVLGDRLREKGMGPRVYPTSAPRSTVSLWWLFRSSSGRHILTIRSSIDRRPPPRPRIEHELGRNAAEDDQHGWGKPSRLLRNCCPRGSKFWV